MTVKAGENIRMLRRARKMTQEQLAEALGVSTGAVHKWESGASLPEIRLLLELADLFCVSVDMLLGYEMRKNGVEDILERLNEQVSAKDYDLAACEAEKALLRYPNSLKIVYFCAEIYQRKGLEMNDMAASQRAIELFERSIALLPQNDDPEISEQTIRSSIAVCHVSIKKYKEAVEILKRYNAGGINNSMIALICSNMDGHDMTETEGYLMKALTDISTSLVQTMSGYVVFSIRKGAVKKALEAAEWFVGMLDSLKISRDTVCYLDRVAAPFDALAASFMLHLGRSDEAEAHLRMAFDRAQSFDAAPVYSTQGVKFFEGDNRHLVISDDLGETAMSAVEKMLDADERNRQARDLWEQLKTQHTATLESN